MNIVQLSISEIKPYSRNAKKHTQKQIDGVAESIKQFGFVQPVVVDAKNEIVIGHCRFEAAKKLNYDKIPCVRCDELSSEQIKALRLADNKLNESKWDEDILKSELSILSLDNFCMSFFGFDEIEKEVEEVKTPTLKETSGICKKGDIWRLGEHVLMCGDSTKEDDVSRLMNGSLAFMVMTDPPYNVNIQSSKGLKIENDNMLGEEFYEFLYKAFNNVFSFLANGGVLHMVCFLRAYKL